MPVGIRTRTDTRELDNYLNTLKATPQLIQEVVKKDVFPEAQRIATQELAPYPPPIARGEFKKHATPKQIRFVMWKIRTGQWTGRTGAFQAAWEALSEVITNGARVIIGNRSKVARFIVGVNQQRFLKHWLLLEREADWIHPRLVKTFFVGFRKRFKTRLKGQR